MSPEIGPVVPPQAPIPAVVGIDIAGPFMSSVEAIGQPLELSALETTAPPTASFELLTPEVPSFEASDRPAFGPAQPIPEAVQQPPSVDASLFKAEDMHAGPTGPSIMAAIQAAKQQRLALSEIFYLPDPQTHLGSLPAEGFESEQHREELIRDIIAVGLPVDNYTSFSHVQNVYLEGTGYHLGAWGHGPENNGTLYTFERLNRMPEARLQALAHESAHANSPLRRENAYLYDGENERAEAALYVENLAGQSLLTDRYLNGYHAYWAALLKEGKIDAGTFMEETQAIAAELGLTNRAKLAQVQASQHVRFAQLQRQGLISPDTQPVYLLSHAHEDGHIEVDGIDTQLITLTREVDSYGDLLQHVSELKRQFYSAGNASVASERWSVQMAPTPNEWIITMGRRVVETGVTYDDEEIERENRKRIAAGLAAKSALAEERDPTPLVVS